MSEFLLLLFAKRKLILSMAKRDLAQQYSGSVLGFLWLIIGPAVTIFLFWMIFSVGFKVQPVNEVPFVVWLTCGMAAWFVFADVVRTSASVIIEYQQLIKKTIFPASILPVVKLVSATLAHGIFLLILATLMISQGIEFRLQSLQFVYYLVYLLVLGLGFGWLVAALSVFLKDTIHVVGVLLQFGFWGTPIFWDLSILPTSWQPYIKLNPVYYAVDGYRESFIDYEPFWVDVPALMYAWGVSIAVVCIGAYVFKSLRPQFADAL